MQIVLNADDFGYSEDTVRATIECLDDGLLTGATIMPRMPASDLALDYARSRPDASFGVHLTFVGDGVESAVAATDLVPHLVDDAGRLRPTRAVRLDAMLRRLPTTEIVEEAAAQIQSVFDAGVAVSHVDSHRHLHKFAAFRAALRQVLPRFGIERVRNVQDVYLARPLASPTYWLGAVWRRRLMRDFLTTDHFYMPTTTGDENWQRVGARLGSLSGSTLEVGLHPGEQDDWRRRERESLAAFVDAVKREGHTLAGWRELKR